MKKLSLLVGALGGTLAGYLFSNKKLREELVHAKSPEEAAKKLGTHLQRDGKQLAKQVQEFVESDDVQANLSKAKRFASAKLSDAKKELSTFMSSGAKKAKRAAGTVATKAVSKAKKVVKGGKRRIRARLRKVS